MPATRPLLPAVTLPAVAFAAVTLAAVTLATAPVLAAAADGFWGDSGHRMVAAAAAAGLPDDVPAFFRDAAPQLAWLNPEPDRWRDREAREMDEAYKYDHYIDLEALPAGALDAADRYEFIEALYRAGVEEPEQAAGFLPFHMVELYQRLENGFRRWRAASTDEERRWIEARIVNDAGTLGHYVADAANPHHTTIHFNGWAKDAPNPRGFTTANDFHWRFESLFVEAHITLDDVLPRVPAGAAPFPDPRAALLDFIHATHTLVVPMYELEQEVGFTPAHPHPRTISFTLDRLTAGATMLRDTWYSAWVNSAP